MPTHFATRDLFFAFIGATILMIGCWFIAGPSLGLFLGGMALAAILAPPLGLLRHSWINRIAIVGCITDAVAAVWLVACIGGHVSFAQWIECYALLIAWTFFIASIAWLAASGPLRIHAVLASALATFLALAWIAAPIWLSPGGSSAAMQQVALVHPLITINGVIPQLGIWTEQPAMYRLTSLGQDVPYRFNSAWLVSAGYAIAATALSASSAVLNRRRGTLADPPTRSTPPPAPAE